MDEQVFQRVTDLLAPLGMVVDEMDQDASLCASFIWHSALRRLGRVPKMVRGQNLYESPPSEQLQKAIQNTKWRYLQTDHKLHWPETCSILTCRRSSIFAMEGLPYCDIHCGLALLYAMRHNGSEGLVLFGRLALKHR